MPPSDAPGRRRRIVVISDFCAGHVGAELDALHQADEHGVGIEKRDLMSVQFTPDDLEAQMRVKDVFDPKWLLNPAKVFPLGASESRRAG